MKHQNQSIPPVERCDISSLCIDTDKTNFVTRKPRGMAAEGTQRNSHQKQYAPNAELARTIQLERKKKKGLRKCVYGTPSST